MWAGKCEVVQQPEHEWSKVPCSEAQIQVFNHETRPSQEATSHVLAIMGQMGQRSRFGTI